MKRFIIGLGVFIGALVAADLALGGPVSGTWYRQGPVHFEGLVYTGTSGTVLTDAAGKVLSAALNTVAAANGGTGIVTANTAAALSPAIYQSHKSSAITAGTTQTQAGATAITTDFAIVTTGNANDGVILPTAVDGLCIMVRNTSATLAMKLYATSPAKVNGVTTTTGAIIAAFTGVYCCSNGTDYQCTGTST